MKVVVMPNLTRKNGLDVSRKVIESLIKYDIKFRVLVDDKVAFADMGVKFISTDEINRDYDLIIAVGGDGTMIQAAKIAIKHSIAVLGVNAGNLAYLMGLEETETDLLQNLPKKNYNIVDRMVLDVSIFDDRNTLVYEDVCINDVVFRCKDISVTTIDVKCDDNLVNSYTADGIIFSSPTGSTAYNLSALGPIVDPRVETIILTPICPHSLAERPILFSPESALSVFLSPTAKSDCIISFDGSKPIDFKQGYRAVIKRAKKKARFLSLKADTFMDVLNRKMKNQT